MPKGKVQLKPTFPPRAQPRAIVTVNYSRGGKSYFVNASNSNSRRSKTICGVFMPAIHACDPELLLETLTVALEYACNNSELDIDFTQEEE